MKSPEVSVIMSVYNEEVHLLNAIKSILSQTLQNFELIIIDDASTDCSRQVIKQFPDSRIKLLTNETNLGLTKSLNKAITEARGEYIARQDCDDISLPRRLERQRNELKRKSDYALCASGAIMVFNDTKIMFKYIPPLKDRILKKKLLEKNLLIHSTIFFRNSLGINYREKFYYAQDYDLYLRLISGGKKISIIPDCLIKYGLNQNSISFKKRIYQFLFKQKAKDFFEERMRWGKDTYENFNPLEILNINIENIRNTEVIKEQINTDFLCGNIKELRLLYKRYFKLAKLDRYLILYVLSFFPIKIISFVNQFLIKIKYSLE